MVVFTKVGVDKLIDCVMGRTLVVITGDATKVYDELSILLTKASNILDKDCTNTLQSAFGVYSLGAGIRVEVLADDLFKYFGVTHVMNIIPEDAINSRNTGLCYFPHLGETARHDGVFNTYMFNDGSTIQASKLEKYRPTWVKKDTMSTFMPDLFQQHKEAEKAHEDKLVALNLKGLQVGSKVKIKTYEELSAIFGEQILVMGEDDNVTLVEESTDPDAVRFIKTLAYSKLSADYYNGKVGIIEHIDILTGNLVISIDGTIKHTKFVDDGEVQSSGDEGFIFTLEYVSMV